LESQDGQDSIERFSARSCPAGQECPFVGAVRMLVRDMYYGSGKDNPSVTSRLLILEQAVERFASNSNKAVWLGVATLLSALGALFTLIIRGH